MTDAVQQHLDLESPEDPTMQEDRIETHDGDLQAEIIRITKELKLERTYRKELEKRMRRAVLEAENYKRLGNIYRSIKQAAETEAQEPIDDHYRSVLAVLAIIASDPTSCTCQLRNSQHHDTQCPIRIATDAHPILKQGVVIVGQA
jgi:hypothetical protein